MACYVDRVIEIALAEVGYLEKASNKNLDSKTANAGVKNYTKYARDLDAVEGFYNGRKNGYAWCDVFVDWCFYKAYGTDCAKKLLCQPAKSLGAGCEYSMRYYKVKNQFYTSPKIGDQVFFKDGDGDIVHTGIVYKVGTTYVYTVEGNTSSDEGVVANGGCVRAKKYKLDYNRIAGYGRPAYDVKKATTTTPVTETTKKTYDVGDVVQFTGTKHYSSANAKSGKTCKPGKATVTSTYKIGTSKHPYHLKYVSGGGSTVYGWVDAANIKATSTTVKTRTHTVVKGDSLYRIGKKYGVSWRSIATANGIKIPWTIRVGQVLTIPEK